MFKYTILEDEVKSDFAFEVVADSLAELFKGAGLATMSAMIDPSQITGEKKWFIELKSPDEKMLLYDFLSELVYLKDKDTALFNDFEIVIDGKEELHLECKISGAPIDWEKDVLLTDVKAVTMYEFEINKRDNEWYCHVVLDL
ncbi:MAG: archease [Candidatus Heimdallarchaeaceae archaeon]|jgi:SHS2 domain-containing protein